MIKKILALFFVLISLQAKDPTWVKDASKACKKSELCAVGEGESLSRAKRAARLAIGKIFTTQIKSKFSEKISSENGSLNEETSDEVEEITDVVLEGVTITKSHETKTGYFALAALNKRKASENFKREIQKLDEQMTVLMEDYSAGSLMKVEPLYKKREVLNSRVAFLTGMGVPPVVSYEDVFKGKKAAAATMIVHVYLDEDEPKAIETVLAKVLSDRGFKTTSGRVRNKASTHIVTGEYVAEKQYLKVEGFEKYKFLLKIKAANAQKVESGALSTSVITTGRNLAQAMEKALPEIKEYIVANIDKLNIE